MLTKQLKLKLEAIKINYLQAEKGEPLIDKIRSKQLNRERARNYTIDKHYKKNAAHLMEKLKQNKSKENSKSSINNKN